MNSVGARAASRRWRSILNLVVRLVEGGRIVVGQGAGLAKGLGADEPAFENQLAAVLVSDERAAVGEFFACDFVLFLFAHVPARLFFSNRSPLINCKRPHRWR